MKKYVNKALLIFIVASLFVFSGCDELSNLKVNVPISKEFRVHGSDNSISENATYCLSQYKEWRDNVDDIESVEYLAASYWTLKDTLGNVTSPNLRGNVKFTLAADDGSFTLEKDLGLIKVSDFIGNPYEIEYSEAQIDLFNAYLALYKDQELCFSGSVNVDNITADSKNSSGEYELFCKVEFVLKTDVNPN